MADLAGMCRREVLLNLFGENAAESKDVDNCCDVCKMEIQLQDMSEELSIVWNAITNIGVKGEVKISQWIRGSSVAWTSSYNIENQCHMETTRVEVNCGGKNLSDNAM